MKIKPFGKRLLLLVAVLFWPFGIFLMFRAPDSLYTLEAWVAIIVVTIFIFLLSLGRK